MRTNMTGINEVSRSPLHSRLEAKIARQQQAVKLLSETGRKRRDNFSISDSAKNFSRENIAALIDKGANVSASELSYYFANYHNSGPILDAINFGENVSCGYNPNFKEYGVISFTYNGSSQVVPNYAVPKMNAGSLSGIHAVNNSLVLHNKSYYSWTTSSGSRYAWTVNNGKIGWAASESLLAENTNQKGTNYKWEMRKAGNILTCLAQGKDLWGYDREDILSTCEKVGITTGFFSIDAGAGKHNYILQKSGCIMDVDKEIAQLNKMNWIEAGFKEGDMFSVFGNEYAIDSNGHINVSADDTFTSTDIIYPSH
ncbi:MAG: hypothetical protein NC231_09965 [Bacillus sp. (in: Bacteria)]|nr:hypothetical protein [Bacillus sp. (in: firmicutes)]